MFNRPFIVLLVVISLFSISSGIILAKIPPSSIMPSITPTPVIITPTLAQSDNNTLQLRTFSITPSLPIVTSPTTLPTGISSPTFTPTPVISLCPPDGPKGACNCPDTTLFICGNGNNGVCPAGGQPCRPPAPGSCTGNCSLLYTCTPDTCLYSFPPGSYTSANAPCNPGVAYCVGKPVIYLYPLEKIDVSVMVTVPGRITKSIPTYETNGWKHISAYPGGKLIYQNKTYSELYYESEVTHHPQPINGIVIPIANLKNTLFMYTHQLGLLQHEQQEFLDYWLPKLYALHAKYILFSLFTPEQKSEIDHVTINPRPTTDIEFLAYFRPLETPITISKLILPVLPPERKGFTSVEWGGAIDYGTK